MNDENFDKIFGDKLNAGKDFPFSDAKWQKMAQNFDAFQAKRRKRLLWAWLALPLLGLFVLLGWGSWSLYKSQSDIYNLTQEVKMLRQEKLAVSTDPSVNAAKSTLSSVIKSDTVYHHVVVKRYDTIFQTVVRREVSDGVPSSRQDVLMSPKKGKPETTETGEGGCAMHLQSRNAMENFSRPSTMQNFWPLPFC